MYKDSQGNLIWICTLYSGVEHLIWRKSNSCLNNPFDNKPMLHMTHSPHVFIFVLVCLLTNWLCTQQWCWPRVNMPVSCVLSSPISILYWTRGKGFLRCLYSCLICVLILIVLFVFIEDFFFSPVKLRNASLGSGMALDSTVTFSEWPSTRQDVLLVSDIQSLPRAALDLKHADSWLFCDRRVTLTQTVVEWRLSDKTWILPRQKVYIVSPLESMLTKKKYFWTGQRTDYYFGGKAFHSAKA